MSSSFPTRAVAKTFRRTKPPGETEFNALFQLLKEPALLINNSKEQVMLANSPYLKLTAFALNEISGRELRSLVSGLPTHPLVTDEVMSVLLDRRNRSPLSADLHIRPLDATGLWSALIFEPQEDHSKSLLFKMDRVLQALVEMNQSPEEESNRKGLERALNTIHGLLNVSVVALYQVDPKDNQVWKVIDCGEKGILPEVFLPTDLLRLSQTYLWKPGRRVQTELHRTARIQNFSYLATTPTRQNGLLVIADRAQQPPEDLNIVLEACAGQISGMVAHLNQVVDLRRLTVENRNELRIWRAMGENTQEGILLLAPDLTVMETNPASEWMLGYADWELKGQLVENILIGPEQLGSALETACQGIPTLNMGNVSLHRRHGTSFPAHIQVVPVHWEGQTLAIIIFISDVSEHIEFRNRTQQLEQRAVLGEVTAVFAHEVRNPINNISTGLQLLSVKLPEQDPNQENIQRLLNDCTRLNHLMESVLNFSRHAEHKFEEVDLEQLLNRLLDRWWPRFNKVNVKSIFQKEDNTPHVLADPRSLEQVFTNLVSNAVDAMSQSGGTLGIKIAPYNLTAGHPQVAVSVTDSGPGIPDEIRERIFEPFITTKSTGTGLGLAITKRIVTAHHGSINVNSFPGGTVFYVYLSAYQGESA